jgi:hypothetical protein
VADVEYLKEYADNPFDGGEDGGTSRMQSPALKMKFDPKTLVRPETYVDIAGLEFTDVLQSEHFLVAATGKNPVRDTAEHAERLWHDTAFFHPDFANKWPPDKRMLILIVEDDREMMLVGAWYAEMLRAAGQGERANDLIKTWNVGVSSAMVAADPVTADKHNLHRMVPVLKYANKATFDGVWSPFRTHALSGDLLAFHMGGISGFASSGAFWLTNGYSYYKEITLAGETQTVKVMMDRVTEEAKTSGGYEDGRSWVSVIKRKVRRGEVSTDIRGLYGVEDEAATADDYGMAFALNYYLQSTPERMLNFSKMVSRVDSSSQLPVPEELAKIFGFESLEAMEADWVEFMKSPAFK